MEAAARRGPKPEPIAVCEFSDLPTGVMQDRVLAALRRAAPVGINIKKFAEATNASRHSVRVAIQKLREKGLVIKSEGSSVFALLHEPAAASSGQ